MMRKTSLDIALRGVEAAQDFACSPPFPALFFRETHEPVHGACSGILPPILPEEEGGERLHLCAQGIAVPMART